MLMLLMVWLVLFIVLLTLIMRDRKQAGALSLSYFVSLALIHVPGAMVYVAAPYGYEETLLGLEITVLGVGFYVIGVATAQFFSNRRATADIREAPVDPEWLNDIARKFFWIGLFVFFIAIPIAQEIPSVTSVLSAFVGLLVIAFWFWLASAILRHDTRRTFLILLVLPLLPFATLTTIGFVSFSTQWIISVLSFLFIMSRRKLLLIAITPFAFYLALSVFVAYIGERNLIRDAIWYEQADLSTRLERISDIFVNFEPLDINDPKHQSGIDSRLNQNTLVGATVANLQEGSVRYAYGATIPVWAFIPRAVWPDKPEVGGGRSVVSEFTGITFPEGTSVGAGQVLEFYANFGPLGVMIGMFGWGFVLMTLDRGIMTAMSKADMPVLMRRSMVGLTLVSPGGNLLEILIAAIGAMVAAPLIVYLDRKLRSLPLAVFSAKSKRLGVQRP